MRSTILMVFGLLSFSLAKDPKETGKDKADRGPASSAAEIPALDQLLTKGGWLPTPEMSGRYEVGTILDTSLGDHRIMARGCFERQPVVSPYIGAEIVGSMQAGVSVRGGAVSAGGEMVIGKKIKFGTPTTASLERLYMKLSGECSGLLAAMEPEKLQKMYIVQEVLKAEIAEQQCGKISASGHFLTFGSADAEYSQACSQESLEPVAVGYRTLPLVDVLPAEVRLRVQALNAPPIPPIPTPSPTVASASDSSALGARARPPAGTRVLPDEPVSKTATADGKSANSGGHFGVHLGANNGFRYRWHFDRLAVGLRGDFGLAFSNFVSPYVGGFGGVEVELRKDPTSRGAWQFILGGGYPVYVAGGVSRVFGRRTGLRGELGVVAGMFGALPNASLGWMW